MKYEKLVQKLKKNHFKDGQPLPLGCMKNRLFLFILIAILTLYKNRANNRYMWYQIEELLSTSKQLIQDKTTYILKK